MELGRVRLAVAATLMALASLGCSSKPIEPERLRLIRDAKARWARSGPPCYEITEELGNFWAPAGAWTLTVCHGRFVRARDDQGAPPLPSMLSTGFSDDDSVEGLFTELERYAIKDPLDFYYDVEFDPEMGFPRKINNGWRNAYDAEWIVRVVKLVPLDCARCGESVSAISREATSACPASRHRSDACTPSL